jgi:hypothetical protein
MTLAALRDGTVPEREGGWRRLAAGWVVQPTGRLAGFPAGSRAQDRRFLLLHADYGVTLLDLWSPAGAPPPGPAASGWLEAELRLAAFLRRFDPRLPIRRLHLAEAELPALPGVLARAVAELEPLSLPGGDAWMAAVQDMLEAVPATGPPSLPRPAPRRLSLPSRRHGLAVAAIAAVALIGLGGLAALPLLGGDAARRAIPTAEVMPAPEGASEVQLAMAPASPLPALALLLPAPALLLPVPALLLPVPALQPSPPEIAALAWPVEAKLAASPADPDAPHPLPAIGAYGIATLQEPAPLPDAVALAEAEPQPAVAEPLPEPEAPRLPPLATPAPQAMATEAPLPEPEAPRLPPLDAAPPPAPVVAVAPMRPDLPVAPPAQAAAPAAPAPDPKVIEMLIARGNEMLARGDISAARLFYGRAAASGSAVAFTAMGRSHDPAVLEALGVRGIRPDPERAAFWYRRAAEAGGTDPERSGR